MTMPFARDILSSLFRSESVSGKVSCTVSVSILCIYTCTSISEELDGIKTSPKSSLHQFSSTVVFL